jgi:DNA-binding transcriptional MocR family regulator
VKYNGSNAEQIFEHIRNSVVSGDLKEGDLLPPVRDLATMLGVNRNTVSAVYKRLNKAGIALSNGRLGTRICQLPVAGEQEGASDSSALIDLAAGNPEVYFLADPIACLSDVPYTPHLYGDEVILPELESIGRAHMQRDCPKDFGFTLTHGAIDAVDRLLAAHLVSGDKVAVEEPCFLGTINLLRLAGMQRIGVCVDEHGVEVESLVKALKAGVRAVIITPRAHNPTGFSLSAERAAQIKEVLTDYPNVLIIIDDHFSLVSMKKYYSVLPEGVNRWALIRSVSKGFGPDLRIAFSACDPMTTDLLHTKLATGMNWVSLILQRILVSSWRSKECTDKLQQARLFYHQRQQYLVKALQQKNIAVSEHCDGLNVWIKLDVDEKELVLALAKRGWLVRAGSVFSSLQNAPAIRVTVTKLKADIAQRFAEDFVNALSQLK